MRRTKTSNFMSKCSSSFLPHIRLMEITWMITNRSINPSCQVARRRQPKWWLKVGNAPCWSLKDFDRVGLYWFWSDSCHTIYYVLKCRPPYHNIIQHTSSKMYLDLDTLFSLVVCSHMCIRFSRGRPPHPPKKRRFSTVTRKSKPQPPPCH